MRFLPFLLLALAVSPALARASTVIPARVDSLVLAETRVRWSPAHPESALARARRAGVPAFLDFYATWCLPCRWMDRVVYSDPLLAEVAEGVAMIRVDVDRPEGKSLAARMGILQYPTLVYLSPEGRETLRWVGALNLRDTRLNLGQAAVPSAQRPAVEASSRKRPTDAATQASALLFYGYRGEVENARAVAKAYEAAAHREPPASRAPVLLSLGKAEELAGRDERALDTYRRVIELDPAGAFAWRAWLGVSTCLERKGERKEALAAAREAAVRGPRAPYLDARVARLTLDLPRPKAPPGVDDGGK